MENFNLSEVTCRASAGDNDLKNILFLRHLVFVEEQKVPPNLEYDGLDKEAMHFGAFWEGKIVATARAILTDYDTVHLGRIAVHPAYRRQGIGEKLCRYILETLSRDGIGHFTIHAQLHAVGFYEKLGFLAQGEPFDEAGIDHVKMTLDLS